MKVSDILRIKGHTLYSASPDQALIDAVRAMSDKDIGSLVVMQGDQLVGLLTFREVIQQLVRDPAGMGSTAVRTAMVTDPLVCHPETELDEVRRMMLEQHVRYLPVMDGAVLSGVISFYDVAKTVVDSQNFENKMLKAYIRDWPEGQAPSQA